MKILHYVYSECSHQPAVWLGTKLYPSSGKTWSAYSVQCCPTTHAHTHTLPSWNFKFSQQWRLKFITCARGTGRRKGHESLWCMMSVSRSCNTALFSGRSKSTSRERRPLLRVGCRSTSLWTLLVSASTWKCCLAYHAEDKINSQTR